jgi:hypothetical protein
MGQEPDGLSIGALRKLKPSGDAPSDSCQNNIPTSKPTTPAKKSPHTKAGDHNDAMEEFQEKVDSRLKSADIEFDAPPDVSQWTMRQHKEFIRLFEIDQCGNATDPDSKDSKVPGVLWSRSVWGASCSSGRSEYFSRTDFDDNAKACAEHFRKRIVKLGLVKGYNKNTDTPKFCWSEKKKVHFINYHVIVDGNTKPKTTGFRGGSEGQPPPKAWEFAKTLVKDEKGKWILPPSSDQN